MTIIFQVPLVKVLQALRVTKRTVRKKRGRVEEEEEGAIEERRNQIGRENMVLGTFDFFELLLFLLHAAFTIKSITR